MTIYLFRPRNGGHVFLSSHDPAYRYETLCGHCEYPIEADEPTCPRCQKALEDCPVCRERSHRRTPKEPQLADGGHRCAVCGIHRYSVGQKMLAETEGVFCGNLYGCPMGGLVTHQDEVTYWPFETPLCRVCREAALPPRPVASFPHLVRRCLFCSAVFGLDSPNRVRLADGLDRAAALPWIVASNSVCVLCGRNDTRSGEATIQSNAIDPWETEPVEHPEIEIDTYLRVIELGRALILYPESDRKTTRHVYDQWFEPRCPTADDSDRGDGVKVAEVVRHLLQGTLDKNVRSVLQARLEGFTSRWNKMELGLNYVIAPDFRPRDHREEETR